MRVMKIIKILVILFLTFIVCYFSYSKFIQKKLIIKVFGIGYLQVLSGSMYPTIETGEIIVIKEQNNYRVDDIITYNVDNQYLITHRIIEKMDNGVITKGDNNNTTDDEIIKFEQIEGKVIYHF